MSTAVEDTYVGVRFGEETNLTLCRTEGEIYGRGDRVVVDAENGPAFGKVEKSPTAGRFRGISMDRRPVWRITCSARALANTLANGASGAIGP